MTKEKKKGKIGQKKRGEGKEKRSKEKERIEKPPSSGKPILAETRLL